MRPTDWDDIRESEFVDFVESEFGSGTIGFVFEHDEIGLHGFQFNPSSVVIHPCAFDQMGEAND